MKVITLYILIKNFVIENTFIFLIYLSFQIPQKK